ncbi:MAG: K(+)-transporting ATPase subunit F [Betaproteobacteria bacterium]|nr:K(+)-transporting ATPase subunit F [Betaproteobacteria bacterium]
MSLILLLSALVALGLFVYLLAALFFPENFS